MKRSLPILLGLVLFIACQPAAHHSQQDSNSQQTSPLEEPVMVATEIVQLESDPDPDTLTEVELQAIRTGYGQTKAAIKAKRKTLRQQYEMAESHSEKEDILEQAKAYLLHSIPEELLPYWYGTTWDFNGHTNHPREGLIACGYFVSTPLKHIGFPINRYKIAQQASAVIVDTLCSESLRFRDENRLFADVASKPDQLYIVGLDYHVGFLLKQGERIDFIHASYVDPGVAVRENASTSPVFLGSNLYVLGPLLTADGGLAQWFFAE